MTPPAIAAADAAPPPQPEPPQELMTFDAGGQTFALPIGAIRELRAWSVPTPLPLSDPSMMGVINLRGTILPVLDLALRLGIAAPVPPDRPVVMIIQSGDRRAGLRLDRVRDILRLPDGAMEPPHGLSGTIDCLLGLAVVEGQPLRVLDPSRLLPRAAAGTP